MLMSLRDQALYSAKCEEGEWVIRGKRGLVSLYDDGDLDVWITHKLTANRVERSGWKVLNHYDDEACFIRPFSDLQRAGKLVKARRRSSRFQKNATFKGEIKKIP